MPEHADPVVTVTPTIGSGTVIRWYRTLAAAERGNETLSAGRGGVHAEGYITDIPDDWLNTARAAHETLRRDHDADMRHLATHRFKHALGRELEPIVRTGTDA